MSSPPLSPMHSPPTSPSKQRMAAIQDSISLLSVDTETQMAVMPPTISVPSAHEDDVESDDDDEEDEEPFWRSQKFRFAIIALAVIGIAVSLGIIFGVEANKARSQEAKANDSTDDIIFSTGAPIPPMVPETLAPVTAVPATTTDAPVSASPVSASPVSTSGNPSPVTTMVPGTDAPATAAPVTDTPVTDAPGTDTPVTDAPGTEVPVTDAPGTEVPGTEVPVTEAPDTAVPTTNVRGFLSTIAQEGVLDDPDSYQSQALMWLEGNKDASTYSNADLTQRYSLACFFYTTFGIPNLYTEDETVDWMNHDKWVSDDDVCDWYGVDCDEADGSIVALDLKNNNVTGRVPLELGLLGPSLKSLDLSENDVASKDDELAWIADMTELRELNLYFCNFDSVGITTYLGSLEKLEKLDLSYTLMFGSFNADVVFANKPNLQILELGGNLYNTSIPSEIAALPSLHSLYLENSVLTGDLSEVPNMPAIWELWVDLNKDLTGSIPTEIGAASTLASFSASNCTLTGSIPTEMGLLTSMVQLWLFNNQLTGSVPTELGNLVSLKTLHVEGNMLTGTLSSDDVCGLESMGADCELQCDCCTCCGSPCLNIIVSNATDAPVDGSDEPEITVETVINRLALKGGAEFEDPESPQSQALAFVMADPSSTVDQAFSVIQRYALATFFYSTNGVTTMYSDDPAPVWNNTQGWLSEDDECTWYGITCTGGLVTEVALPYNRLSGSVPDEILFLRDFLEYLDLSGNQVYNSGDELGWLETLTQLKYLDLHFCNFLFDGIPTHLAKLVNLEILDISYTLFFGKLDGSIFEDLKKLRYIEMGGNSYNSSLPSELVTLPDLQYLYAELSHMTGDFSFIADMPKALEVWVDYNPDLVGEIPSDIDEASNLRSLSVCNCGLQGTIPTQLGNLPAMEQMWLHNNALTGMIPTEIGDLSLLTTFHTEGNQLSGEMPDEVCALRDTTLEALAADCKLPLPQVSCLCCNCCSAVCLEQDGAAHGLQDVLGSFGAPSDANVDAYRWLEADASLHEYDRYKIARRYALAAIYFSTNSVSTIYTDEVEGADVVSWTNSDGWVTDADECSWYGVVCDIKGDIKELRLADNNLTGTFPIEVGMMHHSLEILDIGGNAVAGSMEELDWIGALTGLKELDIHSCNFYYSGLPPGIASLSKLEILDISYTLITGPLDGSVFEGTPLLSYIEMGGNSYNSSVPSELASLPHLEYLYIENAHLSGNLSFVGDMDFIFEFWADFNPSLSGSIPATIGEATTLASLSLSECNLTGSIPTEIGLLVNIQQMWLYNNSLTGSIPTEVSNLLSLRHFHTEGNMLSGAMPEGICEIGLDSLATDCEAPNAAVDCDCCTCCSAPCVAGGPIVSGSSSDPFESVDTEGRYESQAIAWIESHSDLGYSDQQKLQRYVLATIYLSTNGVSNSYTDGALSEWNNTEGWLTNDDECSWYGISCGNTGEVIAINLSDNGLTGSFPDAVALLKSSLIYLNIGGNSIHNEGSGLDWISKLDNLQYLDVHFNNFKNDGVPAVFPSSLVTLDISYTLFHGPLAGNAFVNLTALAYLDMGGNYYHSSLPSELTSLPNLAYLYSSNAALTGDLSFLGTMTNIAELWLGSNPNIVGSIPASIADATKLASLSLSDCGLTGSIPTEIAQLSAMHQMWLFNNTLTGNIPTEMSTMTELTTFQTQSNSLTGAMPSGVCALRQGLLDSLSTDCKDPDPEVECDCCTCCESPCYGDFKVELQTILETNALSYTEGYQSLAYRWLRLDPGMQAYTEAKMLQRFALTCLYYSTYKISNPYFTPTAGWIETDGWITHTDECDWFGVECDENGVVKAIKLPNNDLGGTIPTEIELLQESLSVFDISGNPVAGEGEELAWIATLPNLQSLDVHFCNFAYDGIPPYISALSKIVLLDISYTLISGEINGAFFVPLNKLQHLEMGGNFYEGAFPTEIANLPLTALYVENANIKGDLSFVSSMGSIVELWMDQNPGLEGGIPESIGDATSLVSLSLSSCGLTGSIPATMGQLVNMEQLWLHNNTLNGTIPDELSNLAKLSVFHTENNDLSGDMPAAICELRDTLGGELATLASDCLTPSPEVTCLCCTCCNEKCYGDVGVSVDDILNVAGLHSPVEPYQNEAVFWLRAMSKGIVQTYQPFRVLQRYALACVFFSTNAVETTYSEEAFPGDPSPPWEASTGWVSDDDECSWHGIECDDDGHVTSIDLSYNGLTGYWPLEIQLLADTLEFLDISGNVVAGDGGSLGWIGGMTSLTHLDVHYNNFQYNGVPPFFAGLSNLQFLDISYTLMHGDIQGSYFEGLDSLSYLEMGGNYYGSPIPSELISLPSLSHLYIDYASVNGDLSFLDYANDDLFEMWLDDNNFDGSLPPSIGNLTNLGSLSLSSCGLTGTLPSEIGELIDMQQMWFFNNTLGGSIPEEVSNLSNLRIFQTEENIMSGEMPTDLCSMRDVFGGKLSFLSTDCDANPDPEVTCDCCTCCEFPCSP